MILLVGPTETYTDVQDALNALAVSVGGSPFLEDHFIEIKAGSIATDVTIPITLQPTPTFRLYISGRYRDHPVFSSVASAALTITVSNIMLSDVELVGSLGFDCLLVSAGVDNLECRRNVIHDGNFLIRYEGSGSTGHQVINNDFYNFQTHGIEKADGDITLLHNSGINKSDLNPAVITAFLHFTEVNLTMHQNAWYVSGLNEEHYCVYLEELNPPFSTFDLSRNLYYGGCKKLATLAKISRRDVVTIIADHVQVQDIGGTTTFTDINATFTTMGLNPGDVVTFETNVGDLVNGGSVVSTANIGQYSIVTLLSDTQLELATNTTAEVGLFEYSIIRTQTEIIDTDQIANWIALTGEVVPLVMDPDFADLGYEGTGPPSLFPGALSPMLQYGVLLPNVPEDIDGMLRPPDFPSIGSHESRGVFMFEGIKRILELIGGLSTQAATKFVMGEEGELSSNIERPEAPLQGALQMDSKNAEMPITDVTVSGGLLTFKGEFIWRWLLTYEQASKCDLSELKDNVLDEFTELGIFTEDNIMLFRTTFPQIIWDPLSIITPVITTKIRFEGKTMPAFFQGGVGYRCLNAEDLIFRDWRALRVVV